MVVVLLKVILVLFVIVEDCVKYILGLFFILLLVLFNIKFVDLSCLFMLFKVFMWFKWLIFMVKWLVLNFYVVSYVVYFDLFNKIL